MSAAAVIEAARRKHIHIATAESCTGGMVSVALTDVAGSSEVFDRGFVTYSNASKNAVLDVRTTTLATHGAVSEAVASEMAEGAHMHSNANITISVTGIAGPGGSGAKPEGMVCFGLSCDGKATITETVQFGALGRDLVRRAAVDHALKMLAAALAQMN